MKNLAIANPFSGITVPGSGVVGDVDVNSADLGTIISKLLPYIFSISAILLLIYLVTGGLQLMLSRGDPKAVQSAQSKITNALIGFIIVIVAYAIVRIIGQILGIDAFRPIFGF